MARRTEHPLGARRAASTFRVGGQVFRTEVGLDFDEPAPQHAAVKLADEDLVEQVARDNARISIEERRVEELA